MNLMRWNPFAELSRFQRELNRVADDPLFRRMRDREEELDWGWQPPVDIYEDPERYVVSAEVPGMKPEDVHVNLENNILTLKGERKLEHEEMKDNYRRVERVYGGFVRSFTLPSTVDESKIAAEYRDGVLRLSLPKRPEEKPKQIEIRVK
jgi:HSP20 family protein